MSPTNQINTRGIVPGSNFKLEFDKIWEQLAKTGIDQDEQLLG